jgi:hypothetical protein
MRIIYRSRGTGKTQSLVGWLMLGNPIPAQPWSWDRAVLVANVVRREAARDMLHDLLGRPAPPPALELAEASNRTYLSHPWRRYQLLREHVLLPTELLAPGRRRTTRLEVAIDDLDDALSVLFMANVVLATLTPEENRSTS